MNWIQNLTRAIQYIEAHLTDDISIDEIAKQAHSASSHFQLVFHVVMGMTIGEYIRNRRLSLAAQDLLQPDSRIIDVAMKYKYETPESFSKAFTRFHGSPPSKIERGKIKLFYPLTIDITVHGGYDLTHTIVDKFLLLDANSIEERKKLDEDSYKKLIHWAGQARGRNPEVFDALTEWVLDDSKWTDAHLDENEWIFNHGVLARFREQNAKLREYLNELKPTGIVNEAIFMALNRFDDLLSGKIHDEALQETVARVFTDFKVMKERSVREKIAGLPTGPAGTDIKGDFGYINHLKDCDAGVQWTLFMPDWVKQQTKGFTIDSFEYLKMPAMRFIGIEGEEYDDIKLRIQKMQVLDAMQEYKSEFDFDLFFMHHNGLSVENQWHGVWGRFMKPGTPVPEGFIAIDFAPDAFEQAKIGPPYLSQFAYATFSGDMHAMHSCEGFDSDAMYDVTRNTILGQGVGIPYPEKYWAAEVFHDGCDNWSTGYLFSVIR